MWHEARRSEKKVHDMMDAARKRAQRRAIYLAKRRGDPLQSIQAVGSRCRVYRDDGLYQAAEDQQGLIPWNGKQDVSIDRFDGRALLDFVREAGSRNIRPQKKSEEEEELEEFVNFERFRDLVKHRRRGFSDDDGLQHVNLELEAKAVAPFQSHRSQPAQSSANKGTYSQVGFSYDGNGKEEGHLLDEDDDEDDDDYENDGEFDSDDSNDEAMETIAKEFGVKRYGWLVYMDKKAKEEEKRQKELIKGDPSIRKLSRKERRKVSRVERDREKEVARVTGMQVYRDPYRESRRSPTYEAYSRSKRSRSRSRSYSPSYSRHYGHVAHSEDVQRIKPKIEYITEFGGSGDVDSPKLGGYSPPPSPPAHADSLTRSEHSTSSSCKDRLEHLYSAADYPLPTSSPPLFCHMASSSRILEALHVDPASGVSIDKEKGTKSVKPAASTSSALSKLSKVVTSGGGSAKQEKKETPQERLKRIMNKQLNKQIKKDSAAEIAKKKEQERQRLEKLAETNRLSGRRQRSRSRSCSPSPRRSRSRSSRRYHVRSRTRSLSHSPRSSKRSMSHSRSPPRSRKRASSSSRSPPHSRRRSRSPSRSPRSRRHSRSPSRSPLRSRRRSVSRSPHLRRRSRSFTRSPRRRSRSRH